MSFATSMLGTIISVMFSSLRHRLRIGKFTGILKVNVQTYGKFPFLSYLALHAGMCKPKSHYY